VPVTDAAVLSSTGSAAVETIVAYDLSAEQWTVRYHFAEPTRQVVFWRNRTALRHEHWTIESPEDAEWRVLDEAEVISMSNPSDRVVLEFANNPADQPGDYRLNESFTDAGVLLFGPYLLLDGGNGHPMQANLQLNADHGQHALSPPDGLRGYLYFGPQRPREVGGVDMIVDPAVPEWIVAASVAALPQLFEAFSQATGRELPFRPNYFLSFRDGAPSRASTSGGTRGHQAQLALEGGYWHHDDEWSRFHWLKFLAHETFHLWNGLLASPADPHSTEWFNEGGADFVAVQSLLGLGLVAPSEAAAYADAARARCAEGAVDDLTQSGLGRLYYACGFTVFERFGSLTPTPDETIAAWLVEVFAATTRIDDRYTNDLLFDAAERAGIDGGRACLREAVLGDGATGSPP
jgi:hypothetical protein